MKTRQMNVAEQSVRSAKLVSTNSIRKAFDLINLNFEILCNVTVQSRSGIVTVKSQWTHISVPAAAHMLHFFQQVSDSNQLQQSRKPFPTLFSAFFPPAHKKCEFL